MKKYFLLLLILIILPIGVLAQGAPTKFIPRYFAIENTAQFPEYLFFAVIWDLEPKLIIIDSENKMIGGEDTGSQATLYYGKREKFTEESIRNNINNFRDFHETKDLNKFSYPIKLSFHEVPADSVISKTTNYLRIKDLNLIERTGPNKEYLILEETRLVLGKTDGSEEVQNLLLNTEKNNEGKKRLPAELAIFISVALPLSLLWIGLSIYGRIKKRKKKK
jgi:hypothetical protein